MTLHGEQLDLASEANHRTANHLAALAAMLRRRASRLERGPDLVRRSEVLRSLTDLQGAIVAMGRLHRTLASAPAHRDLGLADLMTGMLGDFEAIYDGRLRFAVSVPRGLGLDALRASVFMQVFAEIVANAMKYAHPTGVPVELLVLGKAAEQGGLELMISDDGVGLPEGWDESGQEGLGLRLIRSQIEVMDGTVEISSSELGLIFTITLPAAPRARPPLHVVEEGEEYAPRNAAD